MRWVVIFNCIVRVGLIKNVTFEQIPEGGEELSV